MVPSQGPNYSFSSLFLLDRDLLLPVSLSLWTWLLQMLSKPGNWNQTYNWYCQFVNQWMNLPRKSDQNPVWCSGRVLPSWASTTLHHLIGFRSFNYNELHCPRLEIVAPKPYHHGLQWPFAAFHDIEFAELYFQVSNFQLKFGNLDLRLHFCSFFSLNGSILGI